MAGYVDVADLSLVEMPGDDRVTGPVVGILPDPARAQHAAVADFEQATCELIGHGSPPWKSIVRHATPAVESGAIGAASRASARPAGKQRRARMRAQSHHRVYADCRSDRQRHESVTPPHRLDPVRQQMDRDQRQREPHRRLERQHRPDARAVGELGDRRRELRGIGHDADAPHDAHATRSAGEPPNSTPMTAAQLPDTAIAMIVIVVRPMRSARNPAATQPIAPAATVANAASFAAVGATSPGNVSAKLACRKTPIHAHIAYSSHMCPR